MAEKSGFTSIMLLAFYGSTFQAAEFVAMTCNKLCTIFRDGLSETDTNRHALSGSL